MSLDVESKQERTKTLHECITHRAYSQPALYHISARLIVVAPAERNLQKLSWRTFHSVEMIINDELTTSPADDFNARNLLDTSLLFSRPLL